ncbi:signal peptidase I [uncultured Clostridium sp.]|uniref:signal peptidase I n=1 Tax=uncultured Clostridium sp. TaxID=59620 RepID=UPI00260BA4DB|nr:signal peptidase I [uncultured Clostridium sp.]
MNKIKKIVLLSLVILTGIGVYLSIGFTYIIGKSMESTMTNGEILCIDKLYNFEEINRGDIAILDIDYKGKETRVIKRIIGIGGDLIKIEDNKLYINNILISEPYLKEVMRGRNQEFEVPEGKIFIMGDNRNISLDSRSNDVGYIDFNKSIYGKVIFSVSKWKMV